MSPRIRKAAKPEVRVYTKEENELSAELLWWVGQRCVALVTQALDLRNSTIKIDSGGNQLVVQISWIGEVLVCPGGSPPEEPYIDDTLCTTIVWCGRDEGKFAISTGGILINNRQYTGALRVTQVLDPIRFATTIMRQPNAILSLADPQVEAKLSVYLELVVKLLANSETRPHPAEIYECK